MNSNELQGALYTVAVSTTVVALLATFAFAIPADDKPSTVSRIDSFETKMKLLEASWKNGNYDLARSLTHSLRDTVMQTQHEEQAADSSPMNAQPGHPVTSLPVAWQQWAQGWKHFKTVSILETIGELRPSEPVEVTMSFPTSQVDSLAREIRLARIAEGKLIEVPCQVFHELRRGDNRRASILWMAESLPNQRQQMLVFYGNPDAELPEYPSELQIEGEGYGLDISNSVFKATLSRQTGQLERLTLRREHGLELFSGGQGHGEPPGIDWAHDYVDADHFQKLRISLWDECPDYEVIRGPLCTIIRRWGFPHSPVHPIYTPARLHVDVEYRFYAGLPWFHKTGSMTAVQSFSPAALRDDEWVFSGHSFTDKLWMDRAGVLHVGDVTAGNENELWGVGFFNRNSRDSFIALFLEHNAQGLPELRHSGSPTLSYRWHGNLWSRYPLPDGMKKVPAGAVLHQKNAYVSIPFTESEDKSTIETMRRCMTNALVVAASAELPRNLNPNKARASRDRLARPGEHGDQSESKRQIWEALQDCKDAQLYKADISVVDLGLIYDVRIRGDVVTIIMAMPHRGRPLAGYFVEGSISVHPTKSLPIRERLLQLPGVRQVVVEQTWHPAWNSNFLTESGRSKLGLN